MHSSGIIILIINFLPAIVALLRCKLGFMMLCFVLVLAADVLLVPLFPLAALLWLMALIIASLGGSATA